ncbi:MAG: hypothetical protein QM658_03260 [Gordonia sp. (in: high G+C Gram-positive bacteria)]
MPWTPDSFTFDERRAAARTCARAQALIDQLDRDVLGDENAIAVAFAYAEADRVLAELIEELLQPPTIA